MATNASSEDQRARKLRNLFYDIVNGKSQLGRRGNQFIEAICAQTEVAACVTKLVGSDSGLTALQHAIWADHSPVFFNGHAAKLFKYLSSSELESIGNGTVLKKALSHIVEPPIFWTPFSKALIEGKLDEGGKFGFAWLLYHVLLLLPPEELLEIREFASQSIALDPLLNSNELDVRSLAQKIKHRLSVFASTQDHDDDSGPGGRHDNDFPDFRNISIIPTADEVQSIQPAFIRPSSMFDDDEAEGTREATYLDNQFRLLREDMLYEIKDELATERKQRRHRNLVFDGLKLIDIHHQPQDTKKRGIRWGIILQFRTGLHQLLKIKKVEDRKKWLQENRQVLKHQSIVCLLVGQEMVALASINRDEDLLATLPPKLVLHIEGSANIVRALLKLKTADAIKLIQIDTALFAYQPVLQAIQKLRVIPLSKEVLFWDSVSKPEQSNSIQASLLQSLRANPSQDLQPILNASKSITLDKSQFASFVMGLAQALSLIQGPPG